MTCCRQQPHLERRKQVRAQAAWQIRLAGLCCSHVQMDLSCVDFSLHCDAVSHDLTLERTTGRCMPVAVMYSLNGQKCDKRG